METVLDPQHWQQWFEIAHAWVRANVLVPASLVQVAIVVVAALAA